MPPTPDVLQRDRPLCSRRQQPVSAGARSPPACPDPRPVLQQAGGEPSHMTHMTLSRPCAPYLRRTPPAPSPGPPLGDHIYVLVAHSHVS